jgi:hypothetical protein
LEHCEAVVGSKIAEDLQFCSVVLVRVCPLVMGNVDEPHPFQRHELPIIRASEFTLKNATNRASFADKVSPVMHFREPKASLGTTTSGREGRPNGDTCGMVYHFAWSESYASTGSYKTGLQEGAAKFFRGVGEALATRAAVLLVPDASGPPGPRERMQRER